MRKTKIVTISTDGRDKGKRFLITEMPASRAEKWATRAFLALVRAGIEVPDDLAGSGFAGIAAVGVRALSNLQFDEAEPLMDEMMDCVQFMPDKNNPDVVRRLIEDDLEEVVTRVLLKKEVFELHVNFSIADATSAST